MPVRESFTLRKRLYVAIALALGQPSVAVAQDAPQYPDARSPQMRVATIGYRLASMNRQRCPRLEPLTGLLLHDLGGYDPAVRQQIASRYGLAGVGVLGVVPGSAAADAGLRPGDDIRGLDGKPLAPVNAGPTASYDGIALFTDMLVQRLMHGEVALTVMRAGEPLTVTLLRRDGCAARVALLPGRKPDAWSDGRYAAVTQALAEAAGDDELGFALGHEMAHVVLGHAAEPHGALTGIGIGGKRSREREREADRRGVTMSLAAGYREAGAERLLDRLANAHASGLSLTHPSVRARIAAIRETAAAFSPEAR